MHPLIAMFRRGFGENALLAFTAIRSNDRVGLIIFTDRVRNVIAPRKGSRHVLRLIRDILAFAPDREGGSTSIKAGLQALSAVLKRRAVVFLVSDFQDRGYEASYRVFHGGCPSYSDQGLRIGLKLWHD